jgi:phenylpropionate dioxygenase-like ring-hydroxylating dioxygenase large terminal subunit
METTPLEIEVADDVNSSTTLPPSLYTDPAVFARERDTIFRRDWIAVARSEWLAAPDSYLACDLVGDPIVLTRDGRGELRAFSNVCLHRACPVASGRGHATQLTCPYHRWTYALDGRVKGTPLMDRAQAFDRSALRLAPLAVAEWLGWVFVNADADAAPLAPRLTALHDLLAPYGVETMRICRTLRFESRWNWKVMVENFMESYHHMGAHPETLNAAFPAAGTHWVDLPGEFALLENPAKDAGAAPFWVMCVFPSMLFALTRGDVPTGFWYQMDLHGHDHFTLDIHLLAPPALVDDPDFVTGYADVATAIHLEDIPMCEGVWKGLNSAYACRGRLSHLEAANWRFHRYLAERLAGT